MGTNYYAKRKLEYPLTFQVNSDKELEELTKHLKTLQPEIHLGQTKIGYVFLANYNKGQYYNDPISYINFIRDTELTIFDEYGEHYSKLEFIKLVENNEGDHHNGYVYKVFPKIDFLDGEWC